LQTKKKLSNEETARRISKQADQSIQANATEVSEAVNMLKSLSKGCLDIIQESMATQEGANKFTRADLYHPQSLWKLQPNEQEEIVSKIASGALSGHRDIEVECLKLMHKDAAVIGKSSPSLDNKEVSKEKTVMSKKLFKTKAKDADPQSVSKNLSVIDDGKTSQSLASCEVDCGRNDYTILNDSLDIVEEESEQTAKPNAWVMSRVEEVSFEGAIIQTLHYGEQTFVPLEKVLQVHRKTPFSSLILQKTKVTSPPPQSDIQPAKRAKTHKPQIDESEEPDEDSDDELFHY